MTASYSLEHSYAKPELSLDGTCGYSIADKRIIISIDAIANNRFFDNLSGTLSIELWALKHPYQGGEFSGSCLAATTIGEIYSQHFITNCQYDLCFEEPPVGTWHLCLMLREWNGQSYQTQDFVNFSVPYIVNWKPSLVSDNTNNVVTITTKEKVNEKPAPAGKATTKAHKPKVALNKASLEEIAAIKGVSKKLADKIIDSRPFATFEELLKVKGMGKKLLEKIRDSIKL